MYCIRCGVRLADTEHSCPLCGTRCCHPDIPPVCAVPLYPPKSQPQPHVNPLGVMSALTLFLLLPLVLCLLCDLRTNPVITWSGYAVGGIALFYELFLLPGWFRNPNPVIFVPCAFAAILLYLLYIDLSVSGGWFLGFALPLVGGFGLIATTITVLLKYLRRGRLYIFGASSMALGLSLLPLEYLAARTFGTALTGWSLYPFAVLILLGAYLFFLAVCRPARESIARKFFI